MSSASLAIQSAPSPLPAGPAAGKGKDAATSGGKGFGEVMAAASDDTPRPAHRGKAPARGGEPAAAEARWTGGRTALEPAAGDDPEMPVPEASEDADGAEDAGQDPIALLMSAVMPQPRNAPPAHAGAEPVAGDAAAGAGAGIDVEADAEAPAVRQHETAAPRADAGLISLLATRQAKETGPAAGNGAARAQAADTAPAKAARDTGAVSTAPTPAAGEQSAETELPESGRKVARDIPAGTVPAVAARRGPAAGPEGRLAEQKVTVTSVQVAPAPSAPQQPLSPTGAALVASIDADGTLASYASDPAGSAMPGADARPVTTIRLQLSPVELGNVNVKISGTGEEIAIEIQVETQEARHRLSSDSDAIVKSLRSFGYDVDRVTVQFVAPSANAGQGQTATGGRGDGFAAFEQRGGERGSGQQNPSSSGGHDHEQHRTGPQAQPDRGGASGAVYI